MIARGWSARVAAAAARVGAGDGPTPRASSGARARRADAAVSRTIVDLARRGAVDAARASQGARPRHLLSWCGRRADGACARSCALYFTSFLFYVLAAVFLVLAGYLFYTNLDFYVRFGGMNLVARPLAVPVLRHAAAAPRARAAADHAALRRGADARHARAALDVSGARPRDRRSGKFLACLVVLAAMILPTLAYPLLLDRFQPGRPGGRCSPATSGSLLLAAAFVACGALPVGAHRQPARRGRDDVRRAAASSGSSPGTRRR